MNFVDKSGFNENMVMDVAKEMFLGTSGHCFKFFWSWQHLKDLPKYRSHRELPKYLEPHFEGEVGDPLNDCMPRPVGVKVSSRLKGDIVVKAAKYKMIKESSNVRTILVYYPNTRISRDISISRDI